MENNKEINNFVDKYININQDRLNNAFKKVNPTNGTLITYLKNNLGEQIKNTLYQGSFSYGTIIKPNSQNDSGEYDVDIALRMKYNSDYEGEEYKYHDLLINIFEGSDRYKDKLDKSKERAVRIVYGSDDGEFHVDLVPMFYDGENWNVIDRKNNNVEISGGTEFRDWVNQKNNETSSEDDTRKYLKQSIRIFKFLRNQSDINLIRSVQLALLLSRQVDKINSSEFTSIANTIRLISKNLKEELEGIENISDLDLSNPGLEEEKFDRNFSQSDYDNFKSWFIDLAEKIQDAYEDEDDESSIISWQNVFGENFTSDTKNNNIVLYDYEHKHSIHSYGITKITNVYNLKITAQRKAKNNPWPKVFASGTSVPNGQTLEFFVNIPFDIGTSRIDWQITNENNIFVMSKRGEFNNETRNLGFVSRKKGYGIREEGRWKGRHLVKCRLLTPENKLIAESDEFIVKIG